MHASREAGTLFVIRNLAYLVFALPVIFIASAQASTRRPVMVSCSCDDAAGRAYAKALHEALITSAVYREADLADTVRNDGLRISIVSLPLNTADEEPPKAALSIVCVHGAAIMHQFIETCTRIPIEACAKNLLLDLADWK
jgi:hypothetical protein